MMTSPEINKSLNLPSRITVYPAQDRAIDHILNDLMKRCPAQYALVAEVSGQLVSIIGDRDMANPLLLTSLIAGDVAASQEIARLTGQYGRYQLVLREGLASNTFVCEAGEYLIVFVLVSKEVPLGWARLLIVEASQKIEEVLAAPPEEIEKLDLALDEKKLTHWVDDTLNSIWKE